MATCERHVWGKRKKKGNPPLPLPRGNWNSIREFIESNSAIVGFVRIWSRIFGNYFALSELGWGTGFTQGVALGFIKVGPSARREQYDYQRFFIIEAEEELRTPKFPEAHLFRLGAA